jgi:aryl-alcohol dehydrogenase-like predicted oxidoreductase
MSDILKTPSRVQLGKTGLEVSTIGCGTWQAGPVWGSVPDEGIIGSVRHALEVGVNFIDTAPTYGEGRAEKLVAKALADVPREDFVLCNKCYCIIRPDNKRVFNLTGDSILKQCEDSLKRLQMEMIDLYLLHAFDPKADPEDATAALEKLKSQGKIRAYGVSNYTVEQFRMALHFGDYAVQQLPYNFTNTSAEEGLLPLALTSGTGVMAYSPLARGILSGKYRGDETFNDSRKGNALFQGEKFKNACDQVQSLAPFAEKYEMTMPQLILAAVLMHPAIDCALTGSKHPDQIEESAAAMGRRIELEDYEDIRDALYAI